MFKILDLSYAYHMFINAKYMYLIWIKYKLALTYDIKSRLQLGLYCIHILSWTKFKPIRTLKLEMHVYFHIYRNTSLKIMYDFSGTCITSHTSGENHAHWNNTTNNCSPSHYQTGPPKNKRAALLSTKSYQQIHGKNTKFTAHLCVMNSSLLVLNSSWLGKL